MYMNLIDALKVLSFPGANILRKDGFLKDL